MRGEGRERVIKSMAKGLTHLAKGLRKRLTDVEQLLWNCLRAGRFQGMKFSGILEAIRERLHRTPSPQGRGSNYSLEMRKNLKFV